MSQSVRTYRRTGDEFSRHRSMYVCTLCFFQNAAIWKNCRVYRCILEREIKPSEIRKLFDCWQKWFHGIALLGTGTQMC